MEARRGDFHQSAWYLTITPHGFKNLSISGRNECPNWPEGSFSPIFPLNSCNWPKAFFLSLFTQQFLSRASSKKTSLLSGKDSFRFLISTVRTFFLPICFASRIFSILKKLNYLTWNPGDTNGLHLGVFWFLLLVPPPVVLVSPIDWPQGVALVHGWLVGRLHLEEPGDRREAEAELLEQGLMVGQTKLEGRPMECI